MLASNTTFAIAKLLRYLVDRIANLFDILGMVASSSLDINVVEYSSI
jgi:hypothetical protein